MRGTYHHGDLQRALKAGTVRMLATVEADAISLREVARNVGVGVFGDGLRGLQAMK